LLAVIDYGAGNLRSVLHALNYLGAENIRVVREARDLRGATKIILPGVGAFGAGIQRLNERELVKPIREAVRIGTPYLGICLGMQFLFERSDEMGTHEGLSLLPGRVTRFPPETRLKIPHMGWNQFSQHKGSPLLKSVAPESYAYFVHSYYCVPANSEDIVATVDYGVRFTAIVQRENIFGVQFHPEKSQQTGLQILSNFLEMTA
jgi:glutamine amidotransferase